jgi:hypothetical protein
MHRDGPARGSGLLVAHARGEREADVRSAVAQVGDNALRVREFLDSRKRQST